MDKIENLLLLIDYLDYNFAERNGFMSRLNNRDFAARDAPRLVRPPASKPDRQSWPSEAMLQDVEFVGCITRLTADRMRFDTDIQQKMIGKFGKIRRDDAQADQEAWAWTICASLKAFARFGY